MRFEPGSVASCVVVGAPTLRAQNRIETLGIKIEQVDLVSGAFQAGKRTL